MDAANAATATTTVSATVSVKLHESWRSRLASEFNKPYMIALKKFLTEEMKSSKIIFPHGQQYFAALDATPFEDVKVVILGQDPYHGDHQAHGLCFSVEHGVAIPPSLKNIYKEIEADLGLQMPRHGCLRQWASQGVLLLNSVLTVERGLAGSHQGRGWETFTDRIIAELNHRDDPLVFMLWGSYAQKKASFVNRDRHLVLTSVHPSPLSAHRGFLGCRHFSQANEFLQKHGKRPIDWRLN